MNTSLYERYASIKRSIAELEKEAEVINKEVISDMEKANLKNIELPFGKFTIATRKKYTYTDKVEKLEEMVKLEKINEQESGAALVEETKYLTFK